MYGVALKNKIIAVHDDLYVVDEFIRKQPNIDEFTVVKIKGRKKAIKQYEDLYLVICNGEYVPHELYDTLRNEIDCDNHDLIECKETLFKLLEDDSLTKKEKNAISKSIDIIMAKIDEPFDLAYSTLSDIRDMNNEFNNKIGIE